MSRWTIEQLKSHPNFGKLVAVDERSLKLKHDNLENNSRGLRSTAAKPVRRMPLDDESESEKANWYFPAARFEITFTVYSVRPADYDGLDIKFLQDFCVKAGIIPDDKWSVLSGRVVSRKAATEGEEKTEITILTL